MAEVRVTQCPAHSDGRWVQVEGCVGAATCCRTRGGGESGEADGVVAGTTGRQARPSRRRGRSGCRPRAALLGQALAATVDYPDRVAALTRLPEPNRRRLEAIAREVRAQLAPAA